MDERETWQDAAHRLAAAAAASGTPTSWFERLYAAAGRGDIDTPWDRDDPMPELADWLDTVTMSGAATAAVVGCGLGADAEFLARNGFRTTGFDISRSAVDGAKRRHPGSAVDYRVADLFDLPADWAAAFDLVVDVFTVQALPVALHSSAAQRVAGLVAPGGTLVAIGGGRLGADPATEGPPFLLARHELAAFETPDMQPPAVELLSLGGRPRWRLVAHRDG